ncbi:Prion-inhibition and propagation domain containing protein [Hyaloscypha variabilis]
MEPVSFAVGVVSLAGLFSTAVEAFEYVQLGRSFGQNFQVNLLRLDVLQLRLSRWGEAVGIQEDLETIKSLQQKDVTADEKATAEKLIGMILSLLEDAKKKSTGLGGDVFNEQADMEKSALSLHDKMRKLCRIRQRGTRLSTKFKWAIYDEKHLRKLVEDITNLIDSLVSLFPAAKTAMETLYTSEAKELGSEASDVPILKDAAAQVDDELIRFIEETLKKQSTQSNTFINYGKVGQQVAQQWVAGNLNFS